MKKSFNYQINGLRAILCILIVLYHFFVRHSGIAVGSYFPNANVVWGAFFVLSGYFISYSNGKYYWKSKIKNTIVPYIISVLIIFIVSLCVLKNQYNITVKDLIVNVLALPMMTSNFKYVDGAHWYIVYLIYFYCAFYVINLISRKSKRITDLLMGFFGVACVVSLFLPDNMGIAVKAFRVVFNARLIFLIMGYFWKKSNEKSFAVKRLISFIFAELYLIHEAMPVNAIYFAFIILILIGCEKEKLFFLNFTPFQIIGTNSLFIYLIHQNLGCLIIDNFENYWAGAAVATINAVAVGIAFGTAYKKILNVNKNKIQENGDSE